MQGASDSNAIAVTGQGSPKGCETSRFLHQMALVFSVNIQYIYFTWIMPEPNSVGGNEIAVLCCTNWVTAECSAGYLLEHFGYLLHNVMNYYEQNGLVMKRSAESFKRVCFRLYFCLSEAL
jgi:hypothetical protein